MKAGDLESARRHCRIEYRLNALIAAYPKPVAAFMNGIVMGGGVGISAHANHPAAAERTVVATPECAVGFVPDAGSADILARAPGRCSEYIGLTGVQLDAADAIHAGFARALVSSAPLPALVKAFAESGDPDVICAFDGPIGRPSGLEMRQASIDVVFSAETIPAVMESLDRLPDDRWRDETRRQLSRGSPLSLAATLRSIRHVRLRPGIASAVRTQYRIAARCMERGEFPEGVRAAIIDRDRAPRWRYGHGSEVPEAVIDSFLAPLEGGDLVIDTAMPG